MSDFKLGMLAKSLRGHDKGQIYVVVGVKENRLLLCDGEFKFLKKPKQKNIHHLQNLNFQDQEIATKLENGLKINDQMIYHTIFKFKKLEKEKLYG